jgi:cobalt/nickel transport system ATP-binding protein
LNSPEIPQPSLEVKNLHYTYEDGRTALEDISLELGGGEAVGILGPNGAGKTTLLLAIAGVLRPQSGEVKIFGTALHPRDPSPVPQELRRRMGVVFQITDDQLFSSTVFDDVAFAPLNFQIRPQEIPQRVQSALKAVGLDGFEERIPQHLSAGEKRRVALATVLSYDPEILILDEPTSDLDPRSRRELVQLLRRMPQTKIIASHDIEFVLKTCTRILILDGGRVRAAGEVAEILSDHELLRRHGLEAPLGLQGLGAEEIGRLRNA